MTSNISAISEPQTFELTPQEKVVGTQAGSAIIVSTSFFIASIVFISPPEKLSAANANEAEP